MSLLDANNSGLLGWSMNPLTSGDMYNGGPNLSVAEWAAKMGFTGNPLVQAPADEHYQAPPTLSQEFLDYAKSNGYGFGDQALNRNDVQSGLFKDGQLIDSTLHRNTLRGSGFDRAMEKYLPVAIAAMGAYGALGAGGAAEALPSSLESAAADVLSKTGLQAGSFGASLPTETGFLTGGGLLGSPAVGETLGSAAANAIAQNGFQAPAFGSTPVEGTPLTASSPLTAAPTPGLLSQAGGALGSAAQWMKDNPLLGKLIMTAGGGLLGGMGGQQSGTASPGPAKKWSSPLQQGLLNPVEQRMPAAIQANPNALQVQGNPYAGAWQYLRGG